MEKEERLAILGTSVSHLLSHAFILSFPVIVLFLNVDYTQIGILSGVLFITYGLTPLPGGWISDKLGERLVLITYLTVSGVFSLLMVLINSFILLLPLAAGIGLAGGLYHPVGLSLMSKVFKENRGQAMGIHGVSGNIGLAIAPPLAVTIGELFHWNLILLPLGFLAFIGSFIFLWGRSLFENDTSSAPVEQLSPVVKTDPTPISRFLVYVLIISACNGIIFDGVKAFINQYLVDAKNFTNAQAGYLTGTLVFAIGMGSQLIFGYLVDKKGSYRMLIVSFVLLFVSVVMIPILSAGMLIVWLAILGFALVSAQPGLNTMVAEASTDKMRGRAYGLNFFSNYGIGGFATPFVGFIADSYTPDYIFYILAGFALIGLFALIFILPRATPETL